MVGHYGPEEWWYSDGTAAANVRAAVFEGDQSTLASIFSDPGLTTPLPNPTSTNGTGSLEFYAVDGDYWIFVGDENYGDSVLANIGPPVTGTGGALLISNNLSDLSNVVTARNNLGLGTAAVADTGTGPTNVILGNDARLTDARTPTAHAATHGVLGSDPVTIAESQVTNLVADLGNKQPLDADLTAIAALTPSNDDIIQRKAGVWTNRTVAQYKTDLAITAADVGAQPIATIDAKGDLYAGTGDNATARRSVGTDGQILTANSGDPTGLSWTTPAADPNAQSRLVIDAKGDLYAGTGNDTTTRLPVGIDGQALRANSATGTGLEWDTLTAGDVGADPAGSAAAAQAASQPLDSDLTQIAALTPVNDDIIQRKAGVWTNRTVAQYKADQAYTPAEIGAVPTTRTLTAGTAMTGGGDLSADRTFNVNLGTTAGTAAAGDDSRITGAQQKSVIDAKGDLYAGTANDTTTRLPVGTDGQLLRANSAAGTGMDWHTVTAAEVGAVPTSRQIIAGTALSGGGDLSADRTLNVVLGTTASTAASGNDPRFTTATYGAMSIPIGEALSTSISTGVISGGTFTVNADPSKINLSAIVGYIVDYHTNPLAPTLTRISLPAQTGVPMDAGSLSRLTTYWMINSSGTLIQTGTSPSRATRRSNLVVGITAQVAGSITVIVSENDQLPQLLDQFMDLSRSLGAFLIAGCSLSANAGLTFQRAIGEVFAVGANQVTNLADPHVVSCPANNPVTFQYGTRASQVFSAPTTTIDPGHYDVADVVTAIPGSPNQATIQRIFYFAASNSTGIQYGQTLYANLDTAVQAINNGTFVANPILTDANNQGILLGAIVLTKGCTDLTDTTTARVFTFGKFAGSVIAGGGISFGTTAGTAAEGNDTRIVGAQQRSALTTKGDLYVATASATTTRQGVGTDGQVLTADSAQTNGIKWAAATDAGAVPKSTVTTKGDLIVATASATVTRRAVGTDGQVLTADSAQADGVKWAAPGVDAGAQQRSTLTTKGDLYVATASATTARQAVGTDGFTMVADSTVTNGLKWAVASSVGVYPRSTGYVPAGMTGTVRSSKAATLNTMFLTPVYLLIGATLTSIAFEVSGNVATALARLGIYGSSASMLPTGSPLADYGTTTADTAVTKTVAVSTVLTPGLYWIAIVGQTAAPTLRFSAGQSPWVASATFPAGSGVGWNNAYSQTGVTGALPSIGTIADSDAPLIGLKF